MAYSVNYLGQYGWVVVDTAGTPVTSVYTTEAEATAAATTLSDAETTNTAEPTSTVDNSPGPVTTSPRSTSMTSRKTYELGGGYTLLRETVTPYTLSGGSLVGDAYMGGEYKAGDASSTWAVYKDGKKVYDVDEGAAQNLLAAYKTLKDQATATYGDYKGELVASDMSTVSLTKDDIDHIASGARKNSSGEWLSSDLFDTTYSPYQPGEGEEWYIAGYDDQGKPNKWAIRPIPGYEGKKVMPTMPGPGLSADVASTPILPGSTSTAATDTVAEIMAELARRQREETVLATDTLSGYTPVKLRPRSK